MYQCIGTVYNEINLLFFMSKGVRISHRQTIRVFVHLNSEPIFA